MSRRLDVRRMLLRRGWVEDDDALPAVLLRKGDRLWACWNDHGDSALQQKGARPFQVEFNGNVPARVIVAACENVLTSDRRNRTRNRTGTHPPGTRPGYPTS